MKNPHSSLLQTLIGKTIANVDVSTSHGEVLSLTFSDGTQLDICTTNGLVDKTVTPDPDTLYVTIDRKAV